MRHAGVGGSVRVSDAERLHGVGGGGALAIGTFVIKKFFGSSNCRYHIDCHASFGVYFNLIPPHTMHH